MTTLQLLKEALDALNQIPCKKLRGEYKDTYKLASAIGEHIKQINDDDDDAKLHKWAWENGWAECTEGWKMVPAHTEEDLKVVQTTEYIKGLYHLSSIKSKPHGQYVDYGRGLIS